MMSLDGVLILVIALFRKNRAKYVTLSAAADLGLRFIRSPKGC